MDRRKLLGIAGATVAGACLPAVAPAQRRLWRIAYLSGTTSQSNPGWLDAFRKGMAEHGWSEARHYVIDARFAEGVAEVLPRMAADLISTQPDVLLTPAGTTIKLLAEGTKTIPIVFTIAADPVGEGFVKSLQRPGGNLTGLTSLSRDVAAKRLQLLKDAFPAISHVALFFQGGDSNSEIQVKEYQEAGPRLNVRISTFELRKPADIEAAFGRASAIGADAYAIASGFMINVQRKAMVDGVLRAKLPSMGSSMVLADAGILMTYTASIPENFRRAATYVDKILKGAKPGDMAIEQPTKFDFVVNVRTAKALGMTLPPSLLARADRVID
jgi:putative tryptophan/tyrosine transport system substrate-binding protein